MSIMRTSIYAFALLGCSAPVALGGPFATSSAKKQGPPTDRLAEIADTPSCSVVAVENGQVYVRSGTNDLFRISQAGGAPELVLHADGYLNHLQVNGGMGVYTVDLGNHLDRLLRFRLDGGAPIAGPEVYLLVSLAVDGTSTYGTTWGGQHSVFRVGHDATELQRVRQDESRLEHVLVDRGELFFVRNVRANDRHVCNELIGGPPSRPRLIHREPCPNALGRTPEYRSFTVDRDHVYFYFDYRVFRVPRRGGRAEVLAESEPSLILDRMASDGRDLVWMEPGCLGCGIGNGRLLRLRLSANATPEIFAPGQPNVGRALIADRRVYWTTRLDRTCTVHARSLDP